MSLAQRIRKRRESIAQVQKRIDIEIDGFNVKIYREHAPPLVYIPEPSALAYHADKSLVKHRMGCIGSGKSVSSIMDCLFDLKDMPPCLDGIRRARTLMERSTYPELSMTTIKTFIDWFGDTGQTVPGHLKKFTQKPPVYHARLNIICDGVDLGTLEWEVPFLAFEKPDDVEKLKSMELTNAFINECAKLPQIIYTTTLSRVGRYPMPVDLDYQPYRSALKSDTNPPTDTSWLYDLYEKQKPENYKIFRQPPAVIKNSEGKWILNPKAENLKNLRPNYYLDLIPGYSQEQIKVYLQGDYGMAFSGTGVFPEYNDDLHSVDKIEYIPSLPLYLGWDFGLTPCLLVAQFFYGQLRILKEFISVSFGIENLIDSVVRPWFGTNKWNLEGAISIADPAGNARSAKNIFEPTLIEVIQKNFYRNTLAAQTNKQDVRLESTRKLLNRISGGKPALIISRTECPILREGFNGKYYFKEVTLPGTAQRVTLEEPVKSHPHSEPQDCLQYIAVSIAAIGIKEPMTDQAKLMRDRIVGGR